MRRLLALALLLFAPPLEAQMVSPPTRPLALGLSQWPIASWAGGPLTGTMVPTAPKYLLSSLKSAEAAGVCLFVPIPRNLLTSNGQTVGYWNIDAGKRAIEQYRAAVPPDVLAGYVARGVLCGLNIGDDYLCAACWGGVQVDPSWVEQVVAYARIRLGPTIPLGVRVVPSFMRRHTTSLDYAWAQYHKSLGPYQRYYDAQAASARDLGLKLVGGVNTESCTRASDVERCTATELLTFIGYLIPNPGYCGAVSWKYVKEAWDDAARRQAWTTLATQAKQRPARSCKR